MTSLVSIPNPFARHPRRSQLRVATIVWGAALLVGSLQPNRPAGIHFGFLHHAAHIICYGALAFLAAAGYGRARAIPLWPTTCCLLFGLLIEFAEHLQSGMPVEWYDVRGDAIGILLFTALFCALDARRSASRQAEESPDFSPGWAIVTRQGMFKRLLRRLWIYLQVGRFSFMNRFRRASITAAGGPVVSLTSYGERVERAYLVIESIANGNILPSRLILWLDDQDLFDNPPPSLRRLTRRGLEVRLAANDGPHTKYYPYIELVDGFHIPLVTADDDILYPPQWLAGLQHAFGERPDVINCYRARVITFRENRLSKYEHWQLCQSTEPSFQHFALGVSGVIYPPKFLAALKHAGRTFVSCCPKADDIWLHVQAIRAGYKVRQLTTHAFHFPMLPGTQDNALQLSNVSGTLAGNDRQAQLTYNELDLERLHSNGPLLVNEG